MNMRLKDSAAILIGCALGFAAQPALAQSAETPSGQGEQQSQQPSDAQSTDANANQAVAEACLNELSQVAQRMQDDEYWLYGWGAAGTAVDPATGGGTVGTAPPETDPSATASRSADPRGAGAGVYSPRYQIATLYNAAQVLAHQGEQDGCEYVTAQLVTTYESHVSRLQEAGVDPAAVTDWRQEQIALAQPLSEASDRSPYELDDITGTDVRSPEDQSLGSVSDVIIDARSGTASYVLIARGGFLGLGEEHVAVPWNELRATPGLDTIVIDRSQEELEQAPTVDPDRFRRTGGTDDQERINEFWNRG